MPGSGGVAHRTPVDLRTARAPAAQVWLPAFALALVAVWALLYPRTPDLAAQVYRVGLFGQLGAAIWDEHWYAGHALPAYSLLFPPLGALLGIRVVGGLSVLASTLLFERLARSAYSPAAAGWGAALFAVGALGDVWSGRTTFALGVSLALAAALALRRGRRAWAGLLALLCAAASPVAGALLGLAALSVALERRSPRALLILAAPPAVLVGTLVLLFPEGGYEPYPILSFAPTVLAVAAFLWALPDGERLLRIGGWLYLVACSLCLLVHSPIGSNVERYGVLLAGPLLLCARLGGGGGDDRSGGRYGADAVGAAGGVEGTDGHSFLGRRTAMAIRPGPQGITPAVAAALCAITVWVVWGPVRETRAVAGSEATSASYYAPVERFLDSRAAAGPVRVEVPLTRSHWEAALLAPSVSLARGWEKQLETRYDGVLLASGLTAASYEQWLHEQAVAYVALPDVPLDPSSAREGRLIRAGQPYLREVFHSRHWRIYGVDGATPLLSGPGRLTALGHDSFSLQAEQAGSFVVRVRFTRYWTLSTGSGCVERAPGGWTALRLDSPGRAVVTASFSLGRAFGSAGSCVSPRD